MLYFCREVIPRLSKNNLDYPLAERMAGKIEIQGFIKRRGILHRLGDEPDDGNCHLQREYERR